MMRVINLAHGEFLMLGGYAAIVATSHGISNLDRHARGGAGRRRHYRIIVERTIIRFLYGRIIDTMLATWGLSLFLVGLTTAVFGNTTVGISAPLGSFEIGAYRASAYTLFVNRCGDRRAGRRVLRAALDAARTHRARHDAERQLAAALGVKPPRVYAVTFGIGAALSGLAGGFWRRSRASFRRSASPMSPNPSLP